MILFHFPCLMMLDWNILISGQGPLLGVVRSRGNTDTSPFYGYIYAGVSVS